MAQSDSIHTTTLARIMDAVTNGNVEQMMRDYAERATLHFPYASAPNTISGREAISQYLHSALSVFELIMTLDAILPTTDPDVVVVQYSSTGRVTTTTKPYTNSYIGIFTFEGSKVVSQVEYYNPLPAMEAMTP